jgi:hypothetical protein
MWLMKLTMLPVAQAMPTVLSFHARPPSSRQAFATALTS